MNLIQDAGAVWHKLWSVRLAIIAVLFDVVNAGLTYFVAILPPLWFTALSILCTIGAAVARMIDQPGLHNGNDSPTH